MKQQSFQSCSNIITASIDICLHLTNLQNLTQFKLGPLSLSIKVFHSQQLIAIPYQIIPKSFTYTNSQIDLQTYSTQFFYLSADQTFPLDQIIIFKLHFPVNNLSKQSKQSQFKAVIQLKTMKSQLQLEYEEQLSQKQQSKKVLDKFEVTFSSILYLSSYVPVVFENYGVALEATIYTHLLTCKYNNLFEVYRHQLYQTIDHLVICYNKLKGKVDKLYENINQNVIKNHYQGEYYENHSNQQQQNQQFNIIQQQNYQNYQQFLPGFIDMNKYPQYSKIKQFIDKKISKDQQIKQHKTILISFIKKFIPQMSQKLLFLWKQFLNAVTIQFSQQYKYQYFQNLSIELKKRVEYKYQRINTYQSNSIMRRSRMNEVNVQNCSFSDNIFFTEKDNFVAFNQLKQSYFDNNLHKINQKLIISNQQIDYPLLRVLLSKSKQSQSSSIISHSQPHILVFVHGLGASTSAFSLYQTYFKYIYGNILILNSRSNQKFTSQPIQQMSLKLSMQIISFLKSNKIKQHFKLSFIGHSLGGLIIRATLPKLQMYKYNMKIFITLSTPHLGYFYHNSIINKAGMWALSKFTENYIIDCLLMTQSTNNNNQKRQDVYYRQSYLYNLSKQKGLAWFEDLLFFGCEQDQFVGPLSSIITTKKQIQTKNTLKAQIWQQMRLNIEDQIKQCNVYRGLVQFNQDLQTNFKDNLLGKKSHIMYLSSVNFIYYILLVYKHLFV